jgi:hypothetical protein
MRIPGELLSCGVSHDDVPHNTKGFALRTPNHTAKECLHEVTNLRLEVCMLKLGLLSASFN